MIVIFGIRNCSSCRQALKWFADRGAEHRFHDLREDGLTAQQLNAWLTRAQAANLINKRSTSWRALSPGQREQATGPAGIDLLLETPTLIKRPVVMTGEHFVVGRDEAAWQRLLDADMEQN